MSNGDTDPIQTPITHYPLPTLISRYLLRPITSYLVLYGLVNEG
jgi:hypothetical protein